jgi:uncharacterized protein (DUF952 family)
MGETVYKICPREAWTSAVATGTYTGSEDDLRDGFIHFSTVDQVAATAAKHFSGQDDLLLLAVDAAQLGDDLKWEPSRRGDLFPHLYGTMPVDAVRLVAPLPLGEDGLHRFPEGMES